MPVRLPPWKRWTLRIVREKMRSTRFARSVAVALALVAPVGFVACSMEDSAGALTGSTVPFLAARQTDARGIGLPFVNTFRSRWNSANDGTDYEPCTALSKQELSEIGVDQGSVKDAAGTDGQTLRGCAWKYLNELDSVSRWRISQFVGNSASLKDDKERRSGSFESWLPDVSVAGRVVGVHQTRSGDNCDTYVQSGLAAVSTLVTFSGPTLPPPSEICDRALEFTRATISKMPL